MGGQPEAIRILLADQQALFREAVRTGLEAEGDLRVVGEARNGPEALGEAERTSPDVAIVDMDLPIFDGARTSGLMRERVPQCRVLVLSGSDDARKLVEVLDAGASGYLTKEAPLSDLIQATRGVHRGETIVPPRLVGPLVSRLIRHRREQDEALRLISRLTRREREVLALLARGAGKDAIAHEFMISPQTARTHIQNIIAKLGVHSRLEAAMFVTQHGLLNEVTEGSSIRISDLNYAPGLVT